MMFIDGRNVQKIAMVITDGESHDPVATANEADILRNAGVDMVAIGVGSGVNMDEINSIADEPKEYRVFIADDFNALDYLADTLIEVICRGKWSNLTAPQGNFGIISSFLLNETSGTWTRSEILKLSDVQHNELVFESSFLGTVGIKVVAIAPETIDFDEIIKNIDERIEDSPAVLATNIALLCLLAVGTVIMRRKDIEDEKRWLYRPLCDNPMSPNSHYFISIHTGLWSSGHLATTPFITLKGFYGNTGPRPLVDKGGMIGSLQRWKVANFMLGTEEHIGPLEEIMVWHDGQEPSCRWYLDKILITEKETGSKYVFLCGDWLSNDKGDCKTYKQLLNSHNELHNGKVLFNTLTRFKLFDDYLNREFRNSYGRTCTNYQPNMPDIKKAILPWPSVFLGYVIAFGAIGSGFTFTFFYSLQWGNDISTDWLLSLLFGTTNEMFMLEPLKELTRLDIMEINLKTFNMAPFIVEESPSKIDLKDIPRSRWPGGMETFALENLRKRLLLDSRLFSHLQVIFTHGLYILLVACICSHNYVNSSFLQNDALINQLKPLRQEVYVPNIFPKRSYNGDFKLPPERALMSDGCSYRMGPVRLRQIRVKGNCDVQKTMEKVVQHCKPPVDSTTEETENYCPGWTPYFGNCKKSGFAYTKANSSSAFPFFGTFHRYDGGGYIKDMNPFEVDVYYELSKLRSQDWIDDRTRFIVVEIVSMNVNTKLFSLVSMRFEKPHTGGIFSVFRHNHPDSILTSTPGTTSFLACSVFL
ncbi:hypothetical protein FSP39_003726 [Pinctada imbricata]|uniref:VWFA domain-containing protein n=1 Tax=Pinctada imbricata TaxID=66713 RepID=A0AA89BLH0_PINIB|nr:hypothetical protein FSP39_003726 [Pinctada imbricata]